ncbi:MAG TPA: rod shape-determining protein RodA [Flavobacteriales bacterium]|nr:rod shape-determining protein RodA [Flavobacteriales bacterium]
MRRGIALIDSIDWSVIAMYLILVFMGWANIYAAIYNEEHGNIFDLTQSYGKQLIWILTAIILAIAVLATDRQFFVAFGFPIYILMMLILVAVLIFGKEIGGSKSWFAFGAFSFQPAEFAKFATCMAIAKYLSLLNIKISDLKTKLVCVALIALPMGLILLQGDAGSALVYLSFIFLMYREGLSGNFLLAGFFAIILFIVTLILQDTFINLPFGMVVSGKSVLVSVLALIGSLILIPFVKNRSNRGGAALLRDVSVVIVITLLMSITFIYSVDYVFDEVLSEHQRSRINELLAIKTDPKGTGYNVNQSKIAIGSGGMFGKGYLQGTQTKFDFVPEQSTDFIFCTVGEEWGFLGSFVVISLFIVFLIKIIVMAERQRSAFSRIFGYGVASIIFFHLAVNIGMTIGLAPVIGIPLPFFSYGGSSLWGFTILLFVFIKLDAYRLDSFR